MTDSVAKLIINAVKARCATITVANGFNTNAGQQVFFGRDHFDAEVDTFPCMSLFASEDVVQDNTQNERMDLVLVISVEVHNKVGASNPLDVAEDLVADVKKAVLLLGNRNVGGLCGDLRYSGRQEVVTEDGSDIVSVRITFSALYPEIYGDPYTVI